MVTNTVTGVQTVVAAWGVASRHKALELANIYDSVLEQMLAFYPEEVSRGLISAVSDGECRSSFVQREIRGQDGRLRPQMSTGMARATEMEQTVSRRVISGRTNPGGNYNGSERKKLIAGLTAEYKERLAAIYPAGSSTRPSRVRPSAAARDGSAAVNADVLSAHEVQVLRAHIDKVEEEVRAAKLKKSKAAAPTVPAPRGFALASTAAREAARVDLNLNIRGVAPGSEPDYDESHLDMHAAVLESRGAPQAGHHGAGPETVMCKVLQRAVAALDLEMRLREAQDLSQAEMVKRGMSEADAAGFGYDTHTFLPLPEAHEVPLPGGGTTSVNTFVASMFDVPHILKNGGGAVQGAHKRKDPCILDAGKLLEVAMNAEGEFALECVFLEGGIGLDKQSEAAKCCIFTNPNFWNAVRDAGLEAEYLILKIVGEFLHAMQRSGFSPPWRLERLERYSALFYLVMPASTFEAGTLPQHTLGIPTGIWTGLHQIRDAVSLLSALYPNTPFVLSLFSTYSLEQLWAYFVQVCGGYKPEVRVLEALLNKVILKRELAADVTRPALRNNKRANRQMYVGIEGSTAKKSWNDSSRLSGGELDIEKWDVSGNEAARRLKQLPTKWRSPRFYCDDRKK